MKKKINIAIKNEKLADFLAYVFSAYGNWFSEWFEEEGNQYFQEWLSRKNRYSEHMVDLRSE